MSVLDSFVGFARETTYGTFVAPTRSFEAESDGPKLAMQHLEVRGMRAAGHGVRSDRVKAIKLGGGGALPLTVLNKGFGMLFRAMMGTSAGPTQQGATTAYLQEHDSDSDGPKEFLSAQYVRARLERSPRPAGPPGSVRQVGLRLRRRPRVWWASPRLRPPGCVGGPEGAAVPTPCC